MVGTLASLSGNQNTNALERFRDPLDLIIQQAGEGFYLVHSELTGALQLLPEMRLKLLRGCRSFKTLDEHANHLATELNYGPVHVRAIREHLSELANNGLLVSQQSLLNIAKTAPAESSPAQQISAVCAPTRNRPQGLHSCLQSFMQCSRQVAREMEFFVADQSDDSATIEANLHALSRLKAEYGFSIYYAGREEKLELASSLAALTGHSLALVNFALTVGDGFSLGYGANRNTLLLSTVGALILQTDDDSSAKTIPAPNSSEGLSFSSKFCTLETDFLSPSEAETLEDRFVEEDVFAKHEKILGKTLAECLNTAAVVNLDASRSGFFKRAQGGARVSVTSLGVAGEAGVGTSFHFLTEENRTRQTFLPSEEQYRYAMAHHAVLRSVDHPIITDSPFCCAMHLGLDNRRDLPPFLPVQRNEDGVFGQLLMTSSYNFTAFLPYMSQHTRSSRNHTQAQLLHFARTVPTGDIITTLINALSDGPKYADANQNLITLGKTFEQWGTAPLADFEDLLRVQLTKRACQRINLLDVRLRQYNHQPGYWAKDVKQCIEVVQEAMTQKSYILAADLVEAFGQDQASQKFQELLHRFGQLLVIWGDLKEASRQLKDSERLPLKKI